MRDRKIRIRGRGVTGSEGIVQSRKDLLMLKRNRGTETKELRIFNLLQHGHITKRITDGTNRPCITSIDR